MSLAQLITAVAVVFGAVILVRIVLAMREGLVWIAKAAVFGAGGFLVARLALTQMGRAAAEVTVGSLLGMAFGVLLCPRRSRYIPAETKRTVISAI